MGFTRRVGWVIVLGAVLAAVDGLVHIGGSVRLFGASGVRWPGWAVLVAALVAVFVGVSVAEAGQVMERRRAARRRPHPPAPWVERLLGRRRP